MLRALVVCCLFLLAAARPASAEWHISPMIGLTHGGETNIHNIGDAGTQSHLNIGGTVALLGSGIFGVEGVGIFVPSFKGTKASDPLGLVESSRIFSLMGNAVLTTPRRLTEYSLRPFLSGGFGVIRVSVPLTGALVPSRDTLAGYNIGGGAVGFLTNRTGVRFDFRYYHAFERQEPLGFTDLPAGSGALGPARLSYTTLSVGVVFRR
jgi:hypothetical protein